MTKPKEERVHEVFQNISSKYDFMNSVISFQRHKAWRKDIMNKMNVTKGATSLDLCCGTADWTIAMAKEIGSNGKAFGLDFSENMLKVGQEKVEAEHLSNVELIHGNAMKLPFEDNKFDYVTIGFGLRNVPNLDQVLREMYRVLKPGGIAVCLETSQPTNKLFKKVYYLYFQRIMPMFGKLFAKSYDEYSWLQESASSFPGRNELAEHFEQAGFTNVSHKGYSGGAAAMHMGHKREQNS